MFGLVGVAVPGHDLSPRGSPFSAHTVRSAWSWFHNNPPGGLVAGAEVVGAAEEPPATAGLNAVHLNSFLTIQGLSVGKTGRFAVTEGSLCPHLRLSVPTKRGLCARTYGSLCPRREVSVPAHMAVCAHEEGSLCPHLRLSVPTKRGLCAHTYSSLCPRRGGSVPAPTALCAHKEGSLCPHLRLSVRTKRGLCVRTYGSLCPRRELFVPAHWGHCANEASSRGGWKRLKLCVFLEVPSGTPSFVRLASGPT